VFEIINTAIDLTVLAVTWRSYNEMILEKGQGMDQVDFLNGKTRVFGIVGDPIEQVRSPEMVTWEMHQRGMNAVLVPLHLRAADFDEVMPSLLRLHNLDGLIFTIPFKAKALAYAQALGPQATQVGAINALARHPQGHWVGEIFDGLGCVEGLRRRGVSLRGKRVLLLGLGGAGAAIAAAVAGEHPSCLHMFDLQAERCERMAEVVARISPATHIVTAPPDVQGMDVLLNATPVGMLGDARLPLAVTRLPPEMLVFDAIVKPEETPLLALAEACGCTVVRGREMMRGQIAKVVDYFIRPS
jgi:shikimate dehydrogenase